MGLKYIICSVFIEEETHLGLAFLKTFKLFVCVEEFVNQLLIYTFCYFNISNSNKNIYIEYPSFTIVW